MQLKENDDTEYKSRLFDLLTNYYQQPFYVGTLGLRVDDSAEISPHMLMEDAWPDDTKGLFG